MIQFQLYRRTAVRRLKKLPVMQEKYFPFSFPRASDLYFIVDTAAYRAEYRRECESGLCAPADPHGKRKRVMKRSDRYNNISFFLDVCMVPVNSAGAIADGVFSLPRVRRNGKG